MADDPAAAAAPPPAATTPAAAAPAAAKPTNGKTNGKPNGKRPQPRMVTFTDLHGVERQMPESSLQARIARGAATIVKQRLGISLEEAERIVKAGGAPAAAAATANGTPATPGQQATAMADDAVRRLTAENQRLRSRADREAKRANDEARKRQREVARLKELQLDAEFRAEATAAGIMDPAAADYAVHLFGAAVEAGKATEPKAFFGQLKKTHTYLFAGAAAPPARVEIPADTAPPESNQPGETKPKPPPAGGGPGGGPGAPKNADSMNPQEFAAHQGRYGFRPGQ